MGWFAVQLSEQECFHVLLESKETLAGTKFLWSVGSFESEQTLMTSRGLGHFNGIAAEQRLPGFFGSVCSMKTFHMARSMDWCIWVERLMMFQTFSAGMLC
jgi:hypothetical protein